MLIASSEKFLKTQESVAVSYSLSHPSYALLSLLKIFCEPKSLCMYLILSHILPMLNCFFQKVFVNQESVAPSYYFLSILPMKNLSKIRKKEQRKKNTARRNSSFHFRCQPKNNNNKTTLECDKDNDTTPPTRARVSTTKNTFYP